MARWFGAAVSHFFSQIGPAPLHGVHNARQKRDGYSLPVLYGSSSSSGVPVAISHNSTRGGMSLLVARKAAVLFKVQIWARVLFTATNNLSSSQILPSPLTCVRVAVQTGVLCRFGGDVG